MTLRAIALVGISLSITLSSCKKNSEKYFFNALPAERTGLQFGNRLKPTSTFNMFKYMYFYNGAGVGAGDFNNDGHIDLFFSANQSANKLYLSEGSFHFKDVTAQCGIKSKGWSIGVSAVDINNDG